MGTKLQYPRGVRLQLHLIEGLSNQKPSVCSSFFESEIKSKKYKRSRWGVGEHYQCATRPDERLPHPRTSNSKQYVERGVNIHILSLETRPRAYMACLQTICRPRLVNRCPNFITTILFFVLFIPTHIASLFII